MPREKGRQDEHGRAVTLRIGATWSRSIGARRQHRHLTRGKRAIRIPIHLELPGDLAEDAIGTSAVVAGNRVEVDVGTIGLWVRSAEERDVIGRAVGIAEGWRARERYALRHPHRAREHGEDALVEVSEGVFAGKGEA